MPSPKSLKPSVCKNPAEPSVNTTKILGADPGLRGALVLLEHGKIQTFKKMPIEAKASSPLGRGTLDVGRLILALQELQPEVCVLEKPQFRPGSSAQGLGTCGLNFGLLYGCLQVLAIPIVLVDAVTWTRAIHSLDPACEHMDEAKQKSLLVFRKLYPKSDVTHDGIIDAALIAFWFSWINGKLSK
jgi:hypothetical protein